MGSMFPYSKNIMVIVHSYHVIMGFYKTIFKNRLSNLAQKMTKFY
jgi:hypothetical protein